ncbi:MAG: hypothetical protein HFE90_08070 [Firmicutes bacterium]|nr:hypothetical protein [Bacillota bacterium]
MFRVKREDYNTVQFIPEYNSNHAKPSKTKNTRGKARFIVLFFILLIIIAAAAYGVLYFTYLNPQSQYARAFAAGDYETCTALSKENNFDSGFVSDIETIVTDAGNKILTEYKSGNISSNEAIASLQQYDAASNGAFAAALGQNTTIIESIENVYAVLESAKSSAQVKNYPEAVDYIIQSENLAAQCEIDLSAHISNLINENIYGFKSYYFRQFATQIRSRNYEAIRNSANFILKYTADNDFTTYLVTIQSVENREKSATSASNEARQIAVQADRDARAKEQGV